MSAKTRNAVKLVAALVTIALTILAQGLGAPAALAHSVVVERTEPETGAALKSGPAQVAIMFNEELDTHLSTIKVFNAAGQRVDLKDGGVDLTDPDHASMIVHLPKLDEAAYIVRWHVVLDDGDATDGAFTFTVGNAAPITEPLAAPVAAAAPAPMAVTANPTLWFGAAALAACLVLALGLLWRRRSA
jgi:methionine-rich copper-binding protein CopC